MNVDDRWTPGAKRAWRTGQDLRRAHACSTSAKLALDLVRVMTPQKAARMAATLLEYQLDAIKGEVPPWIH